MLGSTKRAFGCLFTICLSTVLIACSGGDSTSGAGSGFTGDNVLGGVSIWQSVLLVLLAIIIVVPYWKITEKAGYSGWLALLILIPGVNLIYVYFLGFSNWPSLRDSARGPTGSS